MGVWFTLDGSEKQYYFRASAQLEIKNEYEIDNLPAGWMKCTEENLS